MLIKAGEAQRNIGGRAFIVLLVALVTLTPTYSAFAEIYATPVVEPTAIPTETEELQIDSASVEESSASIVPQSIEDEDGIISGCEKVTGEEFIEPGGSWHVECSMTGSLLGRALVQRPSMPPGFTASVEIEGLNALGLEVLLQTRLGLGSTEAYAILDLTLAPIVSVRVRIEIKAPDELAPNYSEIVTFRSCTRGLLAIPGRSCPSFQGFVEIKIKTAPVDISDSFSLECSPPDPSRIRLAGESVSTCTIEATGLYPGSYLQLVDLHSSLEMTSGWSVAFTDMNQSALDVLSVRLHEFDEFSFRVNIVAVACDTHGFEQLFDVGISTVLMLADLEISDETPKTANDMEIGVDTSVNFVRTEITVHPNELEMPYSLHEVTPSETPRVQIEYSVGGCGNWTTTLKMSPFQPTGSTAQGGTVPVVTRVTDADNSLVIDPEQVLFGLPIASGIDPVAGESHSHTFDLEYTVPAGTPVGRYTSTITVTISDAP